MKASRLEPQHRTPHPALRADLSPEGRGEKWQVRTLTSWFDELTHQYNFTQ